MLSAEHGHIFFREPSAAPRFFEIACGPTGTLLRSVRTVADLSGIHDVSALCRGGTKVMSAGGSHGAQSPATLHPGAQCSRA